MLSHECGRCTAYYFHDGMVSDNILWGAAIYQGEFVAVDVSDKENSIILASHPTSSSFTHNCWISNDGNTLFTTDEVSGAYIGAYDVSNLSDIENTDLIQSWSGLVGKLKETSSADKLFANPLSNGENYFVDYIGSSLFNQNILVLLSVLLIPIAWFFLYRTRFGLNLRSVGENPTSSMSRGINPELMRILGTLIGGFLIGIGGAAFSLHAKYGWSEGHTGNYGWICLAIVIFGGWNPIRAALTV